ncbi:MAG TPA: hypothetical protein VK540_30570 [Polyangiaceae bacterium]|jgi:hypothetical protein|nr:hypothetical protein [Polyangiaceae bacterium]
MNTALTLRNLAVDDAAGVDAVAAFLDGLTHEARLAETRALGRDAQRQLYRKAAAAKPLALIDFVPQTVGNRVEVIHHGRNTLPLPGSLRHFQKRFSRPDASETQLYGYNASPFLTTVGPGFFVAVLTAGRPDWEARGAVVIDYFQIPDGPVPAGWPAVIPNTQGLQRFVYHRTRDFMRRVSTHVTIGAAFKEEKSLDHYFILCRQA